MVSHSWEFCFSQACWGITKLGRPGASDEHCACRVIPEAHSAHRQLRLPPTTFVLFGCQGPTHYLKARKTFNFCEMSMAKNIPWGCEPEAVICCSVVQLCPTICDPHGLQNARQPCLSPFPGACSNSSPLSRSCHPTISSSVVPFSCLQSFSQSKDLA